MASENRDRMPKIVQRLIRAFEDGEYCPAPHPYPGPGESTSQADGLVE
jgi:hypothetical protein